MKTRIVWTKIWEDDWFQNLSDPAQKLFLYLITNSRINMCGCYQISGRVLLFDTRIKNLDNAKSELKPKVRFFNDWVYVVNAEGYSGYRGSKNAKVLDKEKSQIPQEVKNALFYEKEYRVSENDDRVSVKSDTTINQKSEIRNNKSNKDIIFNNINTITPKIISEIAIKYQVPESFVKSKLEDVYLWEGEKPGRMKGRNWKLTLMNWVKRDSLKIKTEYAKNTGDIAID